MDPKSSSSGVEDSQLNGRHDKSSTKDLRNRKSSRDERVRVKGQGEKRTERDFIFGRLIGEGSFSNVYLVKDIHTNHEYAIKVCEKALIFKEKKTEHVKQEKAIMNMLNSNQDPTAPFFVKLSYTFHDEQKLYFVMSYCKNGELLDLIRKVGKFDEDSSKFYSGEIIRALEHLHSLNIIHRDLKPENILLDENMHIKITDYGSGKILTAEEMDVSDDSKGRKSSFEGTPQYVSPEVLESSRVTRASDLWALGCVLYQMISGYAPFRSTNQFRIFQMIHKLEYEFPDGFCEKAKDLVQNLLVINPKERLGALDSGKTYTSLRSHPFYLDVNLDTLYCQSPPKMCTFVPESKQEIDWGKKTEAGLSGNELNLILDLDIKDKQINQTNKAATGSAGPFITRRPARKNIADISPEEYEERLAKQKKENKWHCFVEGNLILKQGLVYKRKPNRTYYLEDPNQGAESWCAAIVDVRKKYYEDGGIELEQDMADRQRSSIDEIEQVITFTSSWPI
ncbi:putative 3-phosphoinositide-dependent protein kinase 2 isoform X2 [Oratosquilla oratoria]|uniref:putative 3-phosphoinositide-dependent protein kinase 2 isoform X2 n=1 Tax=Oratosquilla oratoria TaxID=337810 RepID=UPI003F758507